MNLSRHDKTKFLSTTLPIRLSTQVGATIALIAATGCAADTELSESAFRDHGDRGDFQVVDGNLIFEGDINLGSVDEVAESQLPTADPRLQSAGVFDLSREFDGTSDFFNAGNPWPNMTIPWRFTGSLSDNTTKQTEFRDALRHYQERTSFLFQEVSSSFSGDYVGVTGEDVCNSKLGRQGNGFQGINVGANGCGYGPMIHELGHTAGLIHEHQRPDRNDFVETTVTGDNWDAESPGNVSLFTDYDQGSIMHYSSGNAIAAEGTLTDINNNGIPSNYQGASPTLTDNDIRGLQIMYGTEFQPTISAVSRSNNRGDVFVRGTSGAVHWKKFTGTAWSGYQNLGGTILGAPEVVSWGPNRMDVFARGQSRQLVHKYWEGGTWSADWTSLGGTTTGHPSAVSWGEGRIDIFVKGDDGQVLHKAFRNNEWYPSQTGYQALGGYTKGPIEVVSWGPERLDIFMVEKTGRLFHKAWRDDAWYPSETGWENLSGDVVGRVSAVSWGAERLDIFVKGRSGAVLHKAWRNDEWYPSETGWQNLGGSIVGSPTVVSRGPDSLDIFAQSTDGSLLHKQWLNGQWFPSETTWTNRGGQIVGSPEVISWGPNNLEVLVRDRSDRLRVLPWNGGTWTTTFENLGGTLSW
jgi:hypothetical protein